MKSLNLLLVLMIGIGTQVAADSIKQELCGEQHHQTDKRAQDVVPNPDGFYIKSLQTQISHGDPRIIQSVGANFDFCVATTAQHAEHSDGIISTEPKFEVKFLFVPMQCPSSRHHS